MSLPPEQTPLNAAAGPLIPHSLSPRLGEVPGPGTEQPLRRSATCGPLCRRCLTGAAVDHRVIYNLSPRLRAGDAAAGERQKRPGLRAGIGAGRARVPRGPGGKGRGVLKHLHGIPCR